MLGALEGEHLGLLKKLQKPLSESEQEREKKREFHHPQLKDARLIKEMRKLVRKFNYHSRENACF